MGVRIYLLIVEKGIGQKSEG